MVRGLFELFASQVGRGDAQHQTHAPGKDEDHRVVDDQFQRRGGHLGASQFEQGPAHQNPRDDAHCGDTPVGQVVINQEHRRHRGEPDGVALIGQIHPAEVDRQRQPEARAKGQGRAAARWLRLQAGHGEQQDAEHAHAQPLPEPFIGLRDPNGPDGIEQRVPQRCGQAEYAYAPVRWMQDRFEQGRQNCVCEK